MDEELISERVKDILRQEIAMGMGLCRRKYGSKTAKRRASRSRAGDYELDDLLGGTYVGGRYTRPYNRTKPNNWIEYVKKYAKSYGISYRDAICQAAKSYRKMKGLPQKQPSGRCKDYVRKSKPKKMIKSKKSKKALNSRLNSWFKCVKECE